MKRKSLLIVCMALLLLPLVGEDVVTISDIDNSRLLVNQQVGLYVSVINDEGQPVTDLHSTDFTVYEAVPEEPEEERAIVEFRQGININQGINMFLLIDNSGSMYDKADGKPTEVETQQRIYFAKEAVITLLKEIANPADKVGIASFNIKMDNSYSPTKKITTIEQAVSQISKPGKGEGYTELYESLYQSVDLVRNTHGRKVIIMLSDGENYPKEENPYLTERKGLDAAIEYAKDEGISVFCIGLSSGADTETLKRISKETGGAFYSIYDPGKLGELYTRIRMQILNEYWIAFKGGMQPSYKKNVRLVYRDSIDAERDYYSDTMLGLPHEPVNYLFLLAIPLALLLIWLLTKMNFEKKQKLPTLQVLSEGKKRSRKSITITEGQDSILIGAGESSDLTIASPQTMMTGAKVMRKGGSFTIMGDDIKVNNKQVKSKSLTSGDVITIGNTTVVFDEGMAVTNMGTEKSKKK